MTHVHHHHHTHQHHHVGLTHIGGIHETIVSTTRQEIVRPRQQQQQTQRHVVTRAASRRPTYSLLKTIKCGRVQDAFHIIIEHATLPAHALIPAIHAAIRLFECVLGKIDGFDPRVIDVLIDAPHVFTNICLRAGLTSTHGDIVMGTTSPHISLNVQNKTSQTYTLMGITTTLQ